MESIRQIFFLVASLRAIIELLGLCLLGQGVLYVLAGMRREQNIIYRFFMVLTTPPCRLVRALAPPVIPDRLIPALSFGTLLFLWIGLAWLRKFL